MVEGAPTGDLAAKRRGRGWHARERRLLTARSPVRAGAAHVRLTCLLDVHAYFLTYLGGTRRRGRDQTSVVQTTRVRQSKSFASYVAGTKRLLEKSALYASIPEIPAQGRRPPHPRRSELLCFGALRYGSRLAQDIAYRLCPALASVSHQSYVSSATSFNKQSARLGFWKFLLDLAPKSVHGLVILLVG